MIALQKGGPGARKVGRHFYCSEAKQSLKKDHCFSVSKQSDL